MQKMIQHIGQLMQKGEVAAAKDVALELTRTAPDMVDGWLHLGWISERTGDFETVLKCGAKVVKLAPNQIAGHMMRAQSAMVLGEIDQAIESLNALQTIAPADPALWTRMAELYTEAGDFDNAYMCYAAAAKAAANSTETLYNLASACIPLGKMDEADALYGQVIDKDPHDYDAYYNRATLRRQTAGSNHVEEIKAVMARSDIKPGADVQLGYALAKELEDLEDYTTSFTALDTGARARRAQLSYDVQDDVKTMALIQDAMGEEFCNSIEFTNEPGPVFVLGLPRTGTTLVDRILSSHSAVVSLGEINDFPASLTQCVGKVSNKAAMVHASAAMDFDALKSAYLKSTSMRAKDNVCFVDKTPSNFLYLGLIAKAIPNAKIIHLRRGAMDACYAIYKTLFRMGYPYSYSLDDIAEYYQAYHDLMAHWRAHFGNRFIDVDYEYLVQNQEAETRRILDYVGLAFEKACLDFHAATSATATASAAQVREKIHSRSVGRWLENKTELKPLADTLSRAGIPLNYEEGARA